VSESEARFGMVREGAGDDLNQVRDADSVGLQGGRWGWPQGRVCDEGVAAGTLGFASHGRLVLWLLFGFGDAAALPFFDTGIDEVDELAGIDTLLEAGDEGLFGETAQVGDAEAAGTVRLFMEKRRTHLVVEFGFDDMMETPGGPAGLAEGFDVVFFDRAIGIEFFFEAGAEAAVAAAILDVVEQGGRQGFGAEPVGSSYFCVERLFVFEVHE
jgi:hypothetical protein